jgi:Tol biopolymer transport system component
MRKTLLVLASTGLVVLIASEVALTIGMGPARAAYPGKNGKIAFVRPQRSDGRVADQVWTMGSAGGAQRQLTFHKYDSYDPTWSPGGTKIAYARETLADAPDIYKMNADGCHKVALTISKEKNDFEPSWSPTGRKLVFVRDVDVRLNYGNLELFTVNRYGSNLTRLTRTASADEHDPAWSPGGGKIAFVKYVSNVSNDPTVDFSGDGIFVMKPDGSQVPSMLLSPAAFGQYMVPEIADLDWSPNGQWLVFDVCLGGYCGYWGEYDIYKVRYDGTQLTHLANGGTPAWSPSGAKILFQRPSGDGVGTLYKMNADGTNKERVVPGDAGTRIFYPSWQPLH